jgi:hypothetical protein
MTDNELNELIAIRDKGKEIDATHYAVTDLGELMFLKKNVRYDFIYFNDTSWNAFKGKSKVLLRCKYIRSLSDINTIIELEQQKRELESQVEFKVKECIELAQACNRWKNTALTQKDLTNEDN